MSVFDFLLGFAVCFGLGMILLFRVDILLRWAGREDVLASRAQTVSRITARLRNAKDSSINAITDLGLIREDVQDNAVVEYLAELLAGAQGRSIESATWLNVLIQHAMTAVVQRVQSGQLNLEELLNKQVVSAKLPSFLDMVRFTSVHVGNAGPLFTNLEVLHGTDPNLLHLKGDLTFVSDLHCSLALEVAVNLFVDKLASLPVEVAVSSLRFSASVDIQYDHTTQVLRVSLLEMPLLDFTLESEIGYKHPLVDPPHLKVLALTAFEQAVKEYLWPRAFELSLASPGRRATRPRNNRKLRRDRKEAKISNQDTGARRRRRADIKDGLD